MNPRPLRMGLSSFLVAVIAVQVTAQQPGLSQPDYLPSPLVPPANAAPSSPGVTGWPSEELLGPGSITPSQITPSQITPMPVAPGPLAPEAMVPPPVGQETAIVQATEGWIYSVDWLFPGKMTSSVEVGLNGSAGNAETLSYMAGFDMSHKTDVDELGFDLAYTKATADGRETQHNAIFNASYERMLGDSRFNTFVKEAVEYDEFKAFDLRLALNAGVGYHVIDNETTKWKTRFGAGASTEIGEPNDDWTPEGVFGTDYERKISQRQKLKFTTDYFPDWSDFANYRVVTKASYEVLLDEASNLNLKFSINDRYDSTPNGRKPNDINYSVLLLWKM